MASLANPYDNLMLANGATYTEWARTPHPSITGEVLHFYRLRTGALVPLFPMGAAYGLYSLSELLDTRLI